MGPYLDRRALIAGAMALSCLPGRALAQDQAEDVADIAARVEQLVRDFIAALPELRAYTPPRVRIEYTPQLSWISLAEPPVIRLAAWAQCPPFMQDFFRARSPGASDGEVAAFFGDIMHRFLVPHEMSHFVDHRRGFAQDADRLYERELHANRVAVAFWLTREGGAEWLADFMVKARIARDSLLNPVPAGQTPAAYLNANYARLAVDMPVYAWYQFAMFVEAWERREEADFRSLLLQS